MGLLEFVSGTKTQEELDEMIESKLEEESSGDEEGNLKLQKLIRKKIQFDDDPNEPFGYRKETSDSNLVKALKIKFDKEGDARSQKSPEHIEKMLAARKDKMDKYKDNL